MPIKFETHSIPDVLTKDVIVTNENTAKISVRLRKTNRKLVKRMRAIDRKEKMSWQKSFVRNIKG